MLQSILLTIGLIMGDPTAKVETLKVNTVESQVNWKGAKVGGAHTGTVTLSEGELIMEDGMLTGGSFVIDMTTIVNDDLSGEYKTQLEGHLKSDDFFGVENFPSANFEITNVVAQGTDNYKVTGNVTIKGITQEIKFPVSVSSEGDNYNATAQITIDRSDFDVKYGSGSFFDNLGDKVIYDDFNLNVNIKTSK